MKNLKIYDTIQKIEPINRGYSHDKKFCVETTDGEKLLLRVSDMAELDRRETEYEMLQKVMELGIPMSVPLEFGTCKDGVYSIHSWIDGEDVRIDGVVLPKFPDEKKYLYGLNAGKILKKIHSIPVSENQVNWELSYKRLADNKIHNYNKIGDKIRDYLMCGSRYEGDEYILDYIEKNRHLLHNRPLCFIHGDYHPGNMMIENNELMIIDFNRCSFSDPWEDFNSMEWEAILSPHFATGQIRGYFGGEPPLDFFRLLALYIACNTVSYLHGVAIGLYDLTMLNQVHDILIWFDNMNNPVPTWYLKTYKNMRCR